MIPVRDAKIKGASAFSPKFYAKKSEKITALAFRRLDGPTLPPTTRKIAPTPQEVDITSFRRNRRIDAADGPRIQKPLKRLSLTFKRFWPPTERLTKRRDRNR